ncbi:PfkB family carbohydrate kinase [Streptomyces canus]|uniref:PfkB family carbohydrate kinase n=1 Tax=Streptomyces canus TaxID=58343 RepID=UPI0036BEDBF6
MRSRHPTVLLQGPRPTRAGGPRDHNSTQALGLGRLGHPVRLATRVGHDDFGQLLQKHLQDSGVELTPGSVVDAATSTATAVLDATGAAQYTFDIYWALSATAEAALLGDGPPGHVQPARSPPR